MGTLKRSTKVCYILYVFEVYRNRFPWFNKAVKLTLNKITVFSQETLEWETYQNFNSSLSLKGLSTRTYAYPSFRNSRLPNRYYHPAINGQPLIQWWLYFSTVTAYLLLIFSEFNPKTISVDSKIACNSTRLGVNSCIWF